MQTATGVATIPTHVANQPLHWGASRDQTVHDAAAELQAQKVQKPRFPPQRRMTGTCGEKEGGWGRKREIDVALMNGVFAPLEVFSQMVCLDGWWVRPASVVGGFRVS